MTIAELKTRLTIPVIAAPMFIVSGTEMVIESCKNGIVGSFPSLNGRTSEEFEEMLKEVTTALAEYENETGKKAAPFAVNLIVHWSNARVQRDTELCVKYKVPIVITSLGAVKEVVDAVHSYGGLVFHDVIKKRHAEKAAEAGVDGIICVAAGAGGHAGTASPFALVTEVKRFYDGTIILAGSINTGNQVLAAQIMGADFAYLGTRFIATKECRAVPEYKQMILDSGIDDIVYTDKVSGVHASFFAQKIKEAGVKEDGSSVDMSGMYDTEAKAWKDIWSAGQGVCGIDDVPTVAELVKRFKGEYAEAKKSFL